ncbi:hypothetical protein [Massilia sp. 9096]|uniref:hypothetical protein n=1 Tax=Massilia sp. 9096 TaxID=1500894 RepID=UPI000AFE9A16|nr:hypothetical protein [Massilia sp. 9096]
MRYPFVSVLTLLSLAACSGAAPHRHDTVVLHYQHVANVHQINFSVQVEVPGRGEPVQSVLPLQSEGFWAVFLLCSLDATGARIPSFYVDLDRFRVEYGKQRFGPLRPYTLRLDDSVELNKRADTRALADAIAAEIGSNLPNPVFRHGYHPDLNVRFAIYIPRGLPDYSGDQLPLRYEGVQAVVLGNGAPPSDVDVVGLGGTGIAAQCLP